MSKRGFLDSAENEIERVTVKCRKTNTDSEQVTIDNGEELLSAEKIDLERLIRLIHGRRCLWDNWADDFGKVGLVDSAWTRIAEEIAVDVADVRSLWNSVWMTCCASQRSSREALVCDPAENGGHNNETVITGIVSNWSELLANVSRITAITSKHGNKHFLNRPKLPDFTSAFLATHDLLKNTKSGKRRVKWSQFNQVSLDGASFILPRRYTATELLENDDGHLICSASDNVLEENVTVRVFPRVHNRIDDAREVMRQLVYGRCLLLHKHFVPLLNAFSVNNDDDVYLVHQLLDGDLGQVISDSLDHFTISRLLHQLLVGVAQLHRTGTVHKALRPDSIAVNTDASLKIQGFGVGSRHVSPITSYSAPEEILGLPCDSKCDIWSIGCIFAEFFLHSRLFPESGNHWQTICGVLGVKEKLASDAVNNNDLLKSVSAEASLDLSDTLFPPNRPEFGLTVGNARQLLSLMLAVDPNERISADEALQHPYLSRWRGNQQPSISAPDLEIIVDFEKMIDEQRTPEEWKGLIRDELVKFAAANDVFGEESEEEF